MQVVPSSAHDSQHWTTNQGAPVYNNVASLTVGERGPVLLEDYHLVEKLANFSRERIPERVVHARGASAKGFFEVRVRHTSLQHKLKHRAHTAAATAETHSRSHSIILALASSTREGLL